MAAQSFFKVLHVKPDEPVAVPPGCKLLNLNWESDGSCRLMVVVGSAVEAALTSSRDLFPTPPAPRQGRLS